MEANHRSDHEDDPLEQTELVRRLRRMEWPAAPADVKARVLQRVVDKAQRDAVTGDDGAASTGSGD